MCYQKFVKRAKVRGEGQLQSRKLAEVYVKVYREGQVEVKPPSTPNSQKEHTA